MNQELQVIEQSLTPMMPRFEALLSPNGLEARHFMQTILQACERLPMLANPEKVNRQSVVQSAVTLACLGLPGDGVTGQGYLIPFKGKAQAIIGYKGYNTLGGRSGFTIAGSAIYEDDEFEFDLGEGWVKHRFSIANARGKLIGAWAQGQRPGFAALTPIVLGIKDLLAVKGRAPGGKKSDSPWNDPYIGFPAMCEKTAKRRLARSMPQNLGVPEADHHLLRFHQGARMEEAFDEQNLPSRIDPDRGLVIDGKAAATQQHQQASEAPAISTQRQEFALVRANGERASFETAQAWLATVQKGMAGAASRDNIEAFRARNEESFAQVREAAPEVFEAALSAIDSRLSNLAAPPAPEQTPVTGPLNVAGDLASLGTDRLEQFLKKLNAPDYEVVAPHLDSLRAIATEADQPHVEEPDQTAPAAPLPPETAAVVPAADTPQSAAGPSSSGFIAEVKQTLEALATVEEVDRYVEDMKDPIEGLPGIDKARFDNAVSMRRHVLKGGSNRAA